MENVRTCGESAAKADRNPGVAHRATSQPDRSSHSSHAGSAVPSASNSTRMRLVPRFTCPTHSRGPPHAGLLLSSATKSRITNRRTDSATSRSASRYVRASRQLSVRAASRSAVRSRA